MPDLKQISVDSDGCYLLRKNRKGTPKGGALADVLLNYGAEDIGLGITFPFVVATVVAVRLIENEMISILENMADIGGEMPPYLLPFIK